MLHQAGFRSAHAALNRMRSAFEAGDVVALLRVYRAAPETSVVLRVASSLLESFYPFDAFLELAVLLDRCIGRDGLCDGSRHFLREVDIDWRPLLPRSCGAILSDHPVLFFGNHPSPLTPFLVAASLERSELRWFTTSYICRLVPSLGDVSFPMEVPRTHTAWRQGGGRRADAHRLASLMHAVPSRDELRAINRSSLDVGASHVRRGGSAIIHPAGGGTQERHWYPGLGAPVKRLQDAPSERPAYLIPIREENCSNRRVYARLMTGPIARFQRIFLYTGPVRIAFGEPIPVRDVATPTSTAEQVGAWLRARYEVIFAKPESAAT